MVPAWGEKDSGSFIGGDWSTRIVALCDGAVRECILGQRFTDGSVRFI